MQKPTDKTILVTGGGGYVGAVLVPALLANGYHVKVLDLFIYGEHVLDSVKNHPKLSLIKGDLRDPAVLSENVAGCEMVIHLACISNDPSFDLNPQLGRSINLDAFRPLVKISKRSGVKRFIYASSSSVYGVKEEPDVHEEMVLEPLTDYSKFKAECEGILAEFQADDFTTVTLRPATICGFSPRQRLDVIVNIFANLAYNKGEISVFGGGQLRPNIHIIDMVEAYKTLLIASKSKIAGQVFNVGCENHSVMELAKIAKSVVGNHVKLVVTPSDDNRSYHISSDKIKNELGFQLSYSIEDAIKDLVSAFKEGLLPNPLSNEFYFNIKRMQNIQLS